MYVRVDAGELRALATRILARTGLPDGDAQVAADVLVSADMRGIESHGVSRLHSYYLERLRRGLINPLPKVRPVRRSGAVVVLDGDNGLGPVVAYRSMETCLELAREHGLALALTRSSNHFGIAAYYALMAAAEGMVGLCLTNTQPLVIPTFGRRRLLGTNPICLAVPAGRHPPFVLDMATSVVPIGRVEVHARRGRAVPRAWGADADGRPTSDPDRILRGGGLFPLGGTERTSGYKGYGLAAAVDLLAGVLSGSAYLDEVKGPGHPEPCGVGHLFGALRLDLLGDPEVLRDRVDRFIDRLHACPPQPGRKGVLVAGEKELMHERDALAHGVRVRREVLARLRAEEG